MSKKHAVQLLLRELEKTPEKQEKKIDMDENFLRKILLKLESPPPPLIRHAITL